MNIFHGVRKMKLTEIINKAKRGINREIEISNMEWIDFYLKTDRDIQGMEQTYDMPVKTNRGGYCIVKKNIALLAMPDDFEAYKKGKPKQAFRTNYNRAKNDGMECHIFHGIDYLDQIMEINLSKAERAGRAMGDIYTDKTKVESFYKKDPIMFGCFTKEGKLIAYLHLLYVGGQLTLNKILGHGDYLDRGVMYFILGELIRQKEEILDGDIQYIMYGTWNAGVASEGIHYYKKLCGFRGYRIRYHIEI